MLIIEKMRLGVDKYVQLHGQDPRQIILSPSSFRKWREFLAKAIKLQKPGVDTGKPNEPDKFCSIPVRCSEVIKGALLIN